MDTSEETKIAHEAQYAFLAGCIDAWTIMIEEQPEMIPSIIVSMKEIADSLKKSAGVVFSN